MPSGHCLSDITRKNSFMCLIFVVLPARLHFDATLVTLQYIVDATCIAWVTSDDLNQTKPHLDANVRLVLFCPKTAFMQI